MENYNRKTKCNLNSLVENTLKTIGYVTSGVAVATAFGCGTLDPGKLSNKEPYGLERKLGYSFSDFREALGEQWGKMNREEKRETKEIVKGFIEEDKEDYMELFKGYLRPDEINKLLNEDEKRELDYFLSSYKEPQFKEEYDCLKELAEPYPWIDMNNLTMGDIHFIMTAGKAFASVINMR